MRTGSEPIGAGAFTRYNDGSWDETTDQLITGQKSALGVSIQGVSLKQMEELKRSIEGTRDQLARIEALSEAERFGIASGLSLEGMSELYLSTLILSYFSANQDYGVIAQSKFSMIDRPGLSYGLANLAVKPNKLYGVITTGIVTIGYGLDVGHLMHIRWKKDGNMNSFFSYNLQRGQYASSMENSVLETLTVDKSKCSYLSPDGILKNPNLSKCGEGISTTKAIQIAFASGQKIYTLSPKNNNISPAILSKLTGNDGAEILESIANGKTVVFSEENVSISGWSGRGYAILDSETGVGAYLISGKGNGGYKPFEATDILGLTFQIDSALGQGGVWYKAADLASLTSAFGALAFGISGYVVSKSALEFRDNYKNLCLSKDQGEALYNAISSLSIVGAIPSMGIPFLGVTIALAVSIAYLIVLFEAMNFIKINRAIGDC